MKRMLFLFAALLLAPLTALHAATPPQIIWASDPVLPDEAILVIGEGFGHDCAIEMGQLDDEPVPGLRTNSTPAVKQWEAIQPLQINECSLSCVVPKSWPQGCWAFRGGQ